MFGLGAPEILMVLIIALLVLGPKRLPEAARSLGRGIAEFRRASSDLRNAITSPLNEPEPSPALRVPPALPPEASRPMVPPSTAGPAPVAAEPVAAEAEDAALPSSEPSKPNV